MAPARGRRRFLKALGLALGATAGGVGGLALLRGPVPHVAGLKVLTRGQYQTLSALAAALFPVPGPLPTGDLDLARVLDAFLEGEPPWTRRELGMAVDLLEYGPLLFDRRMATFSSLTEAERLAHFESWSASGSLRRRQAALALHRIFSVVFYDRPALFPLIGYQGPAMMR